MWEWTLSADLAGVVMCASALPAIPIIWYVWPDRENPGVYWFVLAMVAGAGWAITSGLEVLLDGELATFAFAHANMFVASFAAVCWFLLAVEYTHKDTVSRLVLGVLLVVPLAVQVKLWSNPGANLIYARGTTVDASGVLQLVRGPGYYVSTAYNYLVVITAIGMWIGEWLTSEGKRRRQTSLLLLATMLLLGGATLTLLEVFSPLDMTPIAFTLSGGIFAYALTQVQFLQVMPAGREKIINTMADAIVVLDSTEQVVDTNPAADELLGDGVVGTHVATAFASHPPLRALVEQDGKQETELELTVDGETHHYDVTRSPIEYGRGGTGEVLVLRDVTSLKRREVELARSQDLLNGAQRL